ncbi:MAG: cupin domain-containing protein [Candidatus Omnitrophica bacterium]|nr:cupin domain-containing protein [Candidatus Omnitrophota bacterium]
MKIHERIKQIREELGMSLQEVYSKGELVFGKKKTLSYRTLQRIEKGYIAKFSSVLRICCVLGIPLEKALRDTELEQRLIIRKKERWDEYTYNDKVQASVISSPSRSFLALEMALKPGGKTPLEQTPPEKRYEKWIYIVSGSILCQLGNEKFILEKRDSISFESSIPHFFANTTKKPCLCVMIQNPKSF